MATRSKSSARAAKPAATAKPPKAGKAAAQPVPPVADEAMSSVAVWDTYQAALQAQRSGDLNLPPV